MNPPPGVEQRTRLGRADQNIADGIVKTQRRRTDNAALYVKQLGDMPGIDDH